MSPTAISYAGNSLQTSNIITGSIDHESIPTKNDTLYALSHANASAIPFTSYPTKPIKITGNIIATTKQLFEAEMDTFRSYFNTTSGTLDISYNGATRRYIATADRVNVTRPQGLTLGKFEVDFSTTIPFGFDIFTTNLYTASGTAQSFTQNVTFSGTAPWQVPVATFTLQTVSGTFGSISFGNEFNGQQATISGTWSPGTVLIFDSAQNQVTINGQIAQFAGALPQFQPGQATFTYSDTFSTRSYLYSVSYIARYL